MLVAGYAVLTFALLVGSWVGWRMRIRPVSVDRLPSGDWIALVATRDSPFTEPRRRFMFLHYVDASLVQSGGWQANWHDTGTCPWHTGAVESAIHKIQDEERLVAHRARMNEQIAAYVRSKCPWA